MKIRTDFHTHTIYSRNNHGKGTIRENAQVAIQKGIKELWITDHGPGHFAYGIERDKFKQIREEIDKVNKEFRGMIEVKFGVEANVMTYNGKIDVKEEEKKYLDGINVGFHYGIIPRDIKSFFYFMILNQIAKVVKPLTPWIREKNTQALIKIVEKEDIKIVTHPGDKVPVDIYKLAKACEKKGTALEINSSHKNMSVEDIKEALKTQVLMSVGSDAHTPGAVGEFSQAIERINLTGVPKDRIINLKG